MNDFTSPNCPKCGGVSTMPIRQGMSLPFKCTQCDHSFSLVTAFKDTYQGGAKAILEAARESRKVNSAAALDGADLHTHSFVLGKTRDGMSGFALSQTDIKNKAHASGLLAGLLRRI